MMDLERIDIESLVENLDPDWKDHFLTVDQAFNYYLKHLTPKEIQDAAKDCLI